MISFFIKLSLFVYLKIVISQTTISPTTVYSGIQLDISGSYVTSINVEVGGGIGGLAQPAFGLSASGGCGAIVSTTLLPPNCATNGVLPPSCPWSNILQLIVGTNGEYVPNGNNQLYTGGYPAAGNGGYHSGNGGGGGGGYSGIYTNPNDPSTLNLLSSGIVVLVIAGGGGGACCSSKICNKGGNGGNPDGFSGICNSGSVCAGGGSQTSGGVTNNAGSKANSQTSNNNQYEGAGICTGNKCWGSGGGSGYWGGGSGGGGDGYSGGGGGSSYVSSTYTYGTNYSSYCQGNSGYITYSYVLPRGGTVFVSSVQTRRRQLKHVEPHKQHYHFNEKLAKTFSELLLQKYNVSMNRVIVCNILQEDSFACYFVYEDDNFHRKLMKKIKLNSDDLTLVDTIFNKLTGGFLKIKSVKLKDVALKEVANAEIAHHKTYNKKENPQKVMKSIKLSV